MARNIRWQVTFKSFNGTTYNVNIYDNDWPAGVVMPVRGAADPFFFEEDDSDDILNSVIRYRTGYIRVIEDVFGALDDIYPAKPFDRYVECVTGTTVIFNGYIQVQDFQRPFKPGPRILELPVVSPLGLFENRTFTVTPFDPPTTVTLGELLDIVMNLGAYEKVTFPDITGTGFDKTVSSLVVCPFNTDYHHSMTSSYMDRMFAPQTYAYLIEAICKAFGWICHDTPQALVFTSFDHKGLYAYYPKGHIGETNYKQNESVSQTAVDLVNHFTSTDNNASLRTILPDTGIEISYEGDDGNPDFTFDRTYFNGVAQQNAQDPREITSICNLLAPLQLHEVTGCSSLSFDSTGKVNPGIGIVAWNGNEGVLISASSSWADGLELFVIRLYRKMISGYSFSLSYDIMTSARNISALEDDDEEATLAHFDVTFNSAQDYIEAHFIYHYGQTIQGGTLLPLDDNFLVFIHNISFEWYYNGEPYASYKYLPASKGDTIPSTGYPAISSSITMPISLYRFNDRMIGDTLLTTKVTEYPYLFQKRTEFVGKFRGTSPDLVHVRMFSFLGKKWRVIGLSFHPWNKVPYTLTLESSPELDGSTHTITASAANTSLDGYYDTVNDGTSFSHLLSAITGYNIASVVIMMGGVDITSTAYNSSTGQIYIASVTGNVVITVVAELPYDAEVEYLQSNGSEWIQTEFIPTGRNLKFTGKFYLLGYSAAYNGWFGSYVGETTEAYRILRGNTDDGLIYFTNGSRASSSGNMSITGVNQMYEFELSNNKLVLNGSTVTSTNSNPNTNTSKLRIFNYSPQTSSTKGRLYWFKIYSNNVLIYDFIPVRKNGVGYLYDKVSGQLFGNANSSGSFTYGNDKNS